MKTLSFAMAFTVILRSASSAFGSIYICNSDPCTVKYVPVCTVESENGTYGQMYVQTHAVLYGQCLVIPDQIYGWFQRTFNIHGAIASVSSGSISLERYTGQTYPGASIWPSVCTNAQPEYRAAKFTIEGYGGPGLPVTLYVDSGPVTVSPTTAYRGDIVTVTPSGTGTGPYTIRARRSDGCQGTYSGTVFSFEFSAVMESDYGPGGTLNGNTPGGYAVFDGPVQSAEVSAVRWASGGRNADVSNFFRAKVVTNPANAYSGGVRANLQVTKQFPTNIRLQKTQLDEGASVSGSITSAKTPWLSLSIPNLLGGDKSVAGASVGIEVSFGGESGTPHIDEHTTLDFIVPFYLDREERMYASQFLPSVFNSQITYTVGSDERRVRLRVSAMAHTTEIDPYLDEESYNTGAPIARVGGNSEDPVFGEADNQFDIP